MPQLKSESTHRGSTLAPTARAKAPRTKTVLIALITLIALATPSTSLAQMTIDDVQIFSGPAYLNGSFTDYFIDPVVFGSELAAVSVSLSSGFTIDFVEVDVDEFACDGAIPSAPCEDFASLAEINALGNLTFNVLGESGETDSWVVPAADYMPGSGQVGFPMVTTPGPSQSQFVPGAAFVWAAPPAWVDAVQVDLVDIATDDGVDEALFLGNATTSWTPANVVAGRDYAFEINFAELFFLEDERTTSQGRAFLFSSGFTAFNRKLVPEPHGTLTLASALTLLVGLGRLRRSARSGARRPRSSAHARLVSARPPSPPPA